MTEESKLGWNIQYRAMPAEQKNGIYTVSRAMGSNTFVVVDDPVQPGDMIYGLQNNFPDAYVILRMYPSGGDENLHTLMSPTQFMNWYDTKVHDSRIIYYYNNEPLPAHSPACVSACIEVVKEAKRRRKRVVVLNASVGSMLPGGANTYKGMEPYRRLFEAIADSNGYAYLGVHEYSRGRPFDPTSDPVEYPWLIGNNEFVIEFCQRNLIPVPPMIVTEFGFDGPESSGAIKNLLPFFDGQDPQGNGQRRAAQLYLEMYNRLYKNNKHVVGVAGYCAGADQVRWRVYNMFDLHNWNRQPHDPPTFISYLMEHTPKENRDMPTSGTEVTIKKLPRPTLNFRSTPAVSATNLVDELVVGDSVHVKTGLPLKSGDHNWYEATNDQGKPGWFAKVQGMETDPELPLVPEPDDLPTDTTTLLQMTYRLIRRLFVFITGEQP